MDLTNQAEIVKGLISIDVALSQWPNITLEVSEHFYVVSWILALLMLIILFNLALLTTGIIVYAIHYLKKMFSAQGNPSVPLHEIPEGLVVNTDQ